ncbi:hypothetical protein BAC1_00503 [uncultured bacterium]|nr:hypothetical protein BAC1_00503 [uncultured bacterium]
MRRIYIFGAFLFLTAALPSLIHAEDCSESYGARLAYGNKNAWKSWCYKCGGSFVESGPRSECRPGPDWGKGSSSSTGGDKVGSGSYQFTPTGDLRIDAPLAVMSGFLNGMEEASKERSARQQAERERAEYEAVMAAQKAAEEAERRKEESFERLSGAVKGVEKNGIFLKNMGDTQVLKLKTGNDFFNSPGNPEGMAETETHRKLALKLGDEPSTVIGVPVKDNGSVSVPPAQVVKEEKLKAGEANLQAAETDGDKALIESMSAIGKRHNWEPEEQARLDKALNELDFDGDPDATPAEIRETWRNMLREGRGELLKNEAAKGHGPGLQWAGAGEQTKYMDCTIFALANASGVPYGVVAARAAELIREADWRGPAAQKKPQEVMEKTGLNGGEVIILAESLGQAEVVKSADFQNVLKEGRPVLVNVAPQNGGSGGHQVVITKTFEHEGQTWYEMMDSNQGAPGRLYLSADELDTILQENGIAFRPEPGRKPALLR